MDLGLPQLPEWVFWTLMILAIIGAMTVAGGLAFFLLHHISYHD